jgi:Uma2 family endonuclease
MPITVQTFEQLALEDSETKWELVCGKLREKPGMTLEHNSVARRLAAQLIRQLPGDDYEVGTNGGYAGRDDAATYLVPDVVVIPVALMANMRGRTSLEIYRHALPFVAEVWSPSTGSYDVDTKFPEYKRRGDLEIWRLHPYEKTLIAWRRQLDGSYREKQYSSGDVPVESLPGVVIRLESLFG